MFRQISYVLSTVLMCGCAVTPPGIGVAASAKKPLPPSTEEQCQAENGRWMPQGIRGYFSCQVRTADFQKVCTANAQCEGLCLVDQATPHGTPVAAGRCSEWVNTGGCVKVIYAGTVQELCAD